MNVIYKQPSIVDAYLIRSGILFELHIGLQGFEAHTEADKIDWFRNLDMNSNGKIEPSEIDISLKGMKDYLKGIVFNPKKLIWPINGLSNWLDMDKIIDGVDNTEENGSEYKPSHPTKNASVSNLTAGIDGWK